MEPPRTVPSNSPPALRRLVACAAISRNQLAQARTLVHSFLRHHPHSRFYLLVVDGLPEGVNVDAEVQLLGLADLPTPYYADLVYTYELPELCAAVKPSLLALLLGQFAADEVVLLDPEMLVLRPLEEVWTALGSANIVLIPNLLRPLPFRDRKPADRDLLIAGAYTAGLMGLKKSDQASAFLRWWEDHLLKGEGAITGEGPVYYPRGFITAQKWLDLVPTLFPGTFLLRDETYNVAWWNLHHRLITGHGDEFRANGRPIACFHFHAFDPTQPLALTKACQNRHRVIPQTPLAELLERYADRLMRTGYPETSQWPTEHHCF